MRCLSCNKNLSDKESTRKYANSGTFVDLCDHCFDSVAGDIPVIDGKGADGEEFSEEEE